MTAERATFIKFETALAYLRQAVNSLDSVRQSLGKAGMYADAGALETMHQRLAGKLRSQVQTCNELREKALQSES